MSQGRRFRRRDTIKGILDQYDSDDVFEHHFPQPRKLKWHQHIFDRSKETCLGRTAKSWCHLLIFYVIFLGCLAALFAICVQFLILNLPDKGPRNKKISPGVSFEPAIEKDKEMYIHFKRGDTVQINAIAQKIDNLVNNFNKLAAKSSRKLKILDTTTNNETIVKDISTVLGKCNKTNKYGYMIGQPCILLKMNKILNFQPEPYITHNEAPDSMPESLKKHIQKLPERNRKHVWISCAGVQFEDSKNLGDVNYYPASRGIKVDLFPANPHPVAVQFPNIVVDKKVTVECRVWAKNIKYEKLNARRDLYGSITFAIQMD